MYENVDGNLKWKWNAGKGCEIWHLGSVPVSDSYAPVYEASGSIKFGRFLNQLKDITAYSNLDFV
jgi:hypothetical protein